MKKSNCTIREAKTKALISCAVTAQLICAFVFAYAKSVFLIPAEHIVLVSVSVLHNISGTVLSFFSSSSIVSVSSDSFNWTAASARREHMKNISRHIYSLGPTVGNLSR